MNAELEREGNRLAKELIAQYWSDFGAGRTWNYRIWPAKYVPDDHWATREQWISAAMACVDSKTNLLQAYEVLLAEGCTEFEPGARALIESWEEAGGHDAYYFFYLSALLPNDFSVRKKYLESVSFAVMDDSARDSFGWYREMRTALLVAEDQRLCEYLANQIEKACSGAELDTSQIEDYALPRLAELGPLANKYVKESVLKRAKHECLRLLEHDRAMSQRRTELDEDERSLWVLDDIAYWSWRLGWTDVLQSLDQQAWYWESLFKQFYSDRENYNLLVWSLTRNNERLKQRALHVMKTHEYHPLDGAIAWSRLHCWGKKAGS